MNQPDPSRQHVPTTRESSATSVKVTIIQVAERLFGRRGLEGVSLRTIAQQAGCRNNTVVQYHFGDKSGLVRAIFEHRLPALDVRRAQLLEQARTRHQLDNPEALMAIILRPIAELVDDQGKHSYAAFLFSLQQVDRAADMRAAAVDQAPLTHHIVNTLRGLLSEVDSNTFTVRIRAVLAGFYSTLIYLDEEFDPSSLPRPEKDRLIEDAIGWAATAMCKPPIKPA